jgi:hypothetical protein
MSNTSIQLKKSGITGNTPTGLEYGELALNFADEKLYFRNNYDSIVYITNQDSFATISANGELILATTPTDTLTLNPSGSITMGVDSISKIITIGLDETAITSFVKKSGDSMTGDLNVLTANVTANNVIVNETLYSGLATRDATKLPNLIAQFTGNTAGYVQVNAQNIDEHGSADFVVTSDVGDDTTFYIDMGIQGSQATEGTLYPLDGYLYVQGNTGQQSGNLIIGTTSGTSGLETRIITGGSDESNVVARFNSLGANIHGGLIVSGNITGPTITTMNSNTAAAFTKANSALALAQAAYNKANTGGGGGGGTTVTISDDNSSDATRYISFTDATSGDVSTLYTASANLTYNPATGTLGVNNLNVTPNTNIASFTTVVTGTSPVVLDSFSNTLYRGAFYQVQMESGGSFHLLNLSVVNSGSTAQVSAFGDAYNAGALATFGASVVGGQVQLIINPTTGSTTVSYLRHALVKLTIGVPAGDMGLVTDSVTSLFDCGFDLDTTTSSFDYGYLS